MVKEIIQYPTTPSLEFGANIRHFDEDLLEIIRDLKDTIEANSLNALAAFQIGSPYAVIVVKNEDGSYLEIVNPRIIKRSGSVEPIETTAYFPKLSAKTKRYEKIKLMYEDKEGKQQFLDAENELAITLQRKIDYVFGSNFRVRLSDEERQLFDSKLEFGTDAITNNGCPSVFKRDRILQLFKILFVTSILGVLSSFFVGEDTLLTLKSIENYLLIFMFGLIVVYFFYAQYEGKQYKNCSSCQIGNIIGTSAIELTKLIILFLLNYFLIW
jgi:peptide deformylase